MRANVLFIIIDQLRADCLDGALSGAVDMPNLRALQAQSVSFDQHYTVCVPCGPARASLFTSLYAMNHRSIRNGTPLSSSHPNIATKMREAGYDPMLFGYTDTSLDPTGRHPNDPDLHSYEGLAPGFSEIVRLRMEQLGSWQADLMAKGYDLPRFFWDIFKPVPSDPTKPPAISDPALYSANDSDTAFLTDQTLREMSVRTKQNWFSTLTYYRPHPPIVAPAPYNKLYAPADSPAPVSPLSIEQMKSSHPFYQAYFKPPAMLGLHNGFNGQLENISAEKTAELRAVYFGLINELDHHIGRVIDFLHDSGQYDDTLIILTADHGEMLGDHHMWGKNTPHNASYHVPLLIRDPRQKQSAGSKITAFTESIDIAPTILEWIGIQSPPGFNGRSLLPWLEGKTPDDWRTHMFAEMDLADPNHLAHAARAGSVAPARQANMAILQDEHFKLVHFNGGLMPLLYDKKTDPHEENNLSQDPAHAAVLLSMTQKMLDHRMTHAHHALSSMTLTSEGVKNV